jgi:hypothetical protein
MAAHKIDVKRRTLSILQAVRKPMTRKELGDAVGFYKLHAILADLRAAGIIAIVENKITLNEFELFEVVK